MGDSKWKSQWTKDYLQSGGVFLLFAWVWIPVAEGEGLQWPTADDAWITYVACFVAGVASIWWARRIKS